MKRVSAFLYFVSAAFLLSGCLLTATGSHHPRGQQTKVKSHRQGPPPHAPAHGYRHRHQGVVLSFDTGIGAYVVIGHPGIYFYDGNYLRRHVRGHWLSSRHYSGPWQNSNARDVPAKLERKMRKKGRSGDQRDRRDNRR